MSPRRTIVTALAFVIAWAIVDLLTAYAIGRLADFLKPVSLPDHIPRFETVWRALALFALFGVGLLTIAAPISACVTVALWLTARSAYRTFAKRLTRSES